MPTPDSALPIPSPSVVFKQLDEGGVLLSTADEVYFGVNRVGARIWALLPPQTTTFEEMCEKLSHEFTSAAIDRIRRDTREFLRELVAAGLAASPSRDGSGESTGASSSPSETS